jgi:hypothetical protein
MAGLIPAGVSFCIILVKTVSANRSARSVTDEIRSRANRQYRMPHRSRRVQVRRGVQKVTDCLCNFAYLLTVPHVR